jgi:hypothetical protein
MTSLSFEWTKNGKNYLAVGNCSWVEIGERKVVEHPRLKIPVIGVVCREHFLVNGEPVGDEPHLKIAAILAARKADGEEMARAIPAKSVEEAETIINQQLGVN